MSSSSETGPGAYTSLHRHGRARQPRPGFLWEEQGQEMKGTCCPLLGAWKAAPETELVWVPAPTSGETCRNQRQLKQSGPDAGLGIALS